MVTKTNATNEKAEKTLFCVVDTVMVVVVSAIFAKVMSRATYPEVLVG
jgi:hypothetical protein